METEFLFHQDRFRKQDALIIPDDIVGRYNSRGYILVRPSQCGDECEKDLKKKRSDFEKIDMEKILSINSRYFDFLHEQSCKHFYEKNHTDAKHTYASDKYGYLMIEEFEENYLIEIREIEFGLISVGAQICVMLRGITLSQMEVNYLFLRENKSTTNL